MDTSNFFDALADVPNLRSANFEDLEIKDGGNVFLFDGYAAVYSSRPTSATSPRKSSVARSKACWRRVRPNVPMLHEHHPHQLLATTRSGRMKLEDDNRGLRVRRSSSKPT
jgi:phage head maturation protease